MSEDDRFLTSVAAVWPEHTLTVCGEMVMKTESGKNITTTIYSCCECSALYWPEDADDEQVYTDRFVPAYDHGRPNLDGEGGCECWDKIDRIIPIVEEPVKGLQRIRDDLEEE